MQPLSFRFYAELNDFLPPNRQHRTFDYPYPGRASIKDTIEALGVPHPEVGLILVHGVPVEFSYLVAEGDHISVYPAFSTLDISVLPSARPRPEPRFVLDVHLGRLADYLRMLGFDTLYRNDYDDAELAQIASHEARILLTRDLGLLKRSLVTYGYFVRETRPQQQVIEVVRRFDLFSQIKPFFRCSRCNGELRPVAKAAIQDQLLPQTSREHNEFRRCAACGQIYWKGSHYARMQQFIDQIHAHNPRSCHNDHQPSQPESTA